MKDKKYKKYRVHCDRYLHFVLYSLSQLKCSLIFFIIMTSKLQIIGYHGNPQTREFFLLSNLTEIIFMLFYSVKAQLISKANFEVFIWTKKRTKIFFYSCPEDILLQNSTFVSLRPTRGNICSLQFVIYVIQINKKI